MKTLKYILFIPAALMVLILVFGVFLNIVNLVLSLSSWPLIFILGIFLLIIFNIIANLMIQTLWRLSPHPKYSIVVFSLVLLFSSIDSIFILWTENYTLVSKRLILILILFLGIHFFHIAIGAMLKQKESMPKNKNPERVGNTDILTKRSVDNQSKLKHTKDEE